MDERQIELLKKALDLYEFVIEKTLECSNHEANEFYELRETLSEKLGIDVTGI